jgi:hypothetical protein
MKVIRILMRIAAITLLLSTLICGLSLIGKSVIDPSSIQFHMTIGIGGILLGIVTMFLPGKNKVKT